MKYPSQRLVVRVAAGSIAAAILAFLVWWNYAWILVNMPSWKSRVDAWKLQEFGDAWERESRKLSGRAAVDCGRVRVRRDPRTATECALEAFRKGRPFRVRYDLLGFDSNVSAGLVYTPEGDLYGLVFDGDPRGQGGTSWSRQRTGKELCPKPFQLYVNPSGRLNCFTKDTVRPHDIMSPNFEPY